MELNDVEKSLVLQAYFLRDVHAQLLTCKFNQSLFHNAVSKHLINCNGNTYQYVAGEMTLLQGLVMNRRLTAREVSDWEFEFSGEGWKHVINPDTLQ